MNKTEYNKRYYEQEKPYPLRLGELKMKLQTDAFEQNTSIPIELKKIVNRHYEKKERVEEIIKKYRSTLLRKELELISYYDVDMQSVKEKIEVKVEELKSVLVEI